jgi:hypothetical protein
MRRIVAGKPASTVPSIKIGRLLIPFSASAVFSVFTLGAGGGGSNGHWPVLRQSLCRSTPFIL